MSDPIDHAFKTTINTSKFEAIVVKSCRSAYTIETVAHDPTLVPHIRIFNVTFSTLEDRDRVRIAMRFLEKEQAELGKAKSQAAMPTLARRLAASA